MDIVINRRKENQLKTFDEIPIGSLFITDCYGIYLKINHSRCDHSAVSISTGITCAMLPFEKVKVYNKKLELNEEDFE